MFSSYRYNKQISLAHVQKKKNLSQGNHYFLTNLQSENHRVFGSQKFTKRFMKHGFLCINKTNFM